MDIAQVARESGVPASTLRYYEEKGLIASTGRHGLRRTFGPQVLERLALIALGQAAGFSLEATVHARNVLVEGNLVGDVSADQKVELVAGADVDGNIRAPKIVVAEGARFRGSVDMGSERPKD